MNTPQLINMRRSSKKPFDCGCTFGSTNLKPRTDMKKAHRIIYLGIRAEQIKERQDKENGHLYTKPYAIELAMEIASNQLEFDLKRKQLRISLDQLLLLTNEECNAIIDQSAIDRAKEHINKTDLKKIKK